MVCQEIDFYYQRSIKMYIHVLLLTAIDALILTTLTLCVCVCVCVVISYFCETSEILTSKNIQIPTF